MVPAKICIHVPYRGSDSKGKIFELNACYAFFPYGHHIKKFPLKKDERTYLTTTISHATNFAAVTTKRIKKDGLPK